MKRERAGAVWGGEGDDVCVWCVRGERSGSVRSPHTQQQQPHHDSILRAQPHRGNTTII